MSLRASLSSLVAVAALAADLHAQGVIHQLFGRSIDSTFGTAVAGAGDLDGDGVPDVVIGGVYDSSNGPQSGLARIVSGATGVTLHTWLGSGPSVQLGRAVDGGADVDADGIPDLVVGANEHLGPGSVWVFSGATKLPLHQFTGVSGPINDEAYGWAAAHAGDVDGDGHGDIVIGAHLAKLTGFESGRSALYSGATGQTLFAWNGIQKGWWEGYSVAAVGDVDGDGFVDIASGSPQESTATYQGGAIRVYSGQTGQVLLFASGYASGDSFGFAVAAAGDVDLDGRADVLVGSPNDSTAGVENGAAIVISGASGSTISAKHGDSYFEHLGRSVGRLGDVNADGREDLIAGAPDDLEIAATITLGSVVAFDGATGQQWFVRRGNAAPANFGAAVAGVGDLDGDGRADFAVGAPQDSTTATDAGLVTIYSDPFASIATYGAGNPGLGAVVPQLDAFGGLATPGNANFALLLTQSVGGAAAVVAIGAAQSAIPTNFGVVLVDPTLPLFLVPFTVGGAPGQPAAGSAFISAPIPPGLPLGVAAYLQAFVFDPAAAGGIASSAGLRIELTR